MSGRQSAVLGNVSLAVNLLLFVATAVVLTTYLYDRANGTNVRRVLVDPFVPSDWESEIATGIRSGPDHAALRIVEFMDFQCPFCAQWSFRLDSLTREFPHDVQVTMHHYPLPQHQHATAAAVAAECADRQGAFESLRRLAFEQQSSIGVKSWESFAEEAGIPNVSAFAQCISLPSDSFPRIEYGRELGQRSRLRGTPLIWINGEIVTSPTLSQLREMVIAETR